NFNPRPDFAGQQAQLAKFGSPRLIQIFGDDRGPRDCRRALLHSHRSGARRVEDEELLTALPHAFLDCPCGGAVPAKRQPAKARMGAEWVMEERQHAVSRTAANWGRVAPVTLSRSQFFG